MATWTTAPASARRLAPRRRGERAAQATLAGGLLLLAALAWWETDRRMAGMSPAPGAHLGPAGLYVVVWVTMTAAMMFPSLAPMVLAHARVRRVRDGRSAAATAGFVSGYLLVWTAYGVAAYVLWASGRALLAGMTWDTGGRWLAAGVLVCAAAYQLVAAKQACLIRCRATVDFLAEEWRPGPRGSLVMGALHGGWCVGCCWTLMASLFALGVMSVGWMAFVAVLIAAEKLLPVPPRASTAVVGGLLALLGAGVALAPDAVPGLVEPGPVTTP